MLNCWVGRKRLHIEGWVHLNLYLEWLFQDIGRDKQADPKVTTILYMKMLAPSFKHQTNYFKPFFVHLYYFRDGLVKSLISNIYCQNIRLWMKCNHLTQIEILLVTQNKSEKMPLK
jgi:hypothetical protein